MNTRPLAGEERSVLDFLLKQEFPGRDELLVQAESVQTGGLSCTCGCPSFSLVPNRSLPPAPVSARVPAEAHGTDPGGNEVGVLLFVDDEGYLLDVEVYSFAGEFGGLPSVDALKPSEWSADDGSGTRHLLNP